MSESDGREAVQSSLSSITNGAGLFFAGRLLSRGLRFLLNFLLTRGLGAAVYGVYGYGMTLFSIAIILARFGTGQSVLRFLPTYEDDPKRRNRIAGLAYLTALIGSILVALTIYVSAPFVSALTLDTPLLVDTLRILAVALPFTTATKLTTSMFRADDTIKYQVLVDDMFRPIVRIVLVGVALALGYTLLGVLAGIVVGAIVVSAVALSVLYSRTSLGPTLSGEWSQKELSEFYSYSAPLTLKDVGTILYNRIDILMVGFFLADTAVGIYRISVMVAMMLVLPLTAFNQLFPPIASRLYDSGNLAELESIYETVTRWSLTVAIPLALVSGLYSSELLAVFGSAFTEGALVLALFTVGQVTNSAVGPSGYMLMMTDHQYLTLINQVILGILNVALNYIFIVNFGLIGAALATASVLAFVNVLRVAEVRYLEGMIPYSVAFAKPLAAGFVAGLVMFGLSTILDGYVLLIGGSIVGGLVFLGVLVALGIETDDRELFEELINNRGA